MNHRFWQWIRTGFVVLFCVACNGPDRQVTGKDSTAPQTTDRGGVKSAGLSKDSSVDWALLGFVKSDSANPVLQPGNGSFKDPVSGRKLQWEEKDVFNPAIVVKDGKIYMLYRAQDRVGKPDGTSRIGLAESTDGLHFKRYPEPILYPAEDAEKKYEWPGGCEDPRVVEDEQGTYYMTYTAYDGKNSRLLIATSKDLLHWSKKGHAFAKAYQGKYVDTWSKSGSIVSRYEKGKILATRINGKYWMYWGEGAIRLATSTDLVHWTPVEDAHGAPVELLRPRPGHFDSTFPETGPPPILTDKGIVVLYNGKNGNSGGDPQIGPSAYAAGEALFDAKDPAHLIGQTDGPVLKPELPYEKTGQYAAGTTFAEGLVSFHNQWFLYYGCADSLVSVATAPQGFYLKAGDTVVFYGDSITEQNYYNQWVELYTATRFPAMRVHFYGAGVGGDRVTGGGGGPIDQRLPRDVFSEKPTVVTVMLGMNDGSYGATTPEIESTYTKGYEHLLDSIREHAPAARVTLLGPSPYDEVTGAPMFPGGYNAVMLHFADLDQDLARKYGATFVNLNPPVVAAIEKAQALDPKIAKLLVPDRVHPDPLAHWVMAEALLKGWNAPALVSSVTIDGGAGQVSDAQSASVDHVERENGTMRWTETENGLPLPLMSSHATQALLLQLTDIQQQLNQEPLRITGLQPGEYKLSIDNDVVGTFSADVLNAGINLAEYGTPMLHQAQRVSWLVRDRDNAHYIHLRMRVRNFDTGAGESGGDRLQGFENSLEDSIYETAAPQPHVFTLSPAEAPATNVH